MTKHEIKDSGKKETFSTGAQRDTREGKGRYDLISPIALRRLALWMEKGATKYGARNWEGGFPVSRCLDSATRHLQKHLAGYRDEDHLAAVLFNVMAIIHFEDRVAAGKLPKELIDWPEPMVEGLGE